MILGFVVWFVCVVCLFTVLPSGGVVCRLFGLVVCICGFERGLFVLNGCLVCIDWFCVLVCLEFVCFTLCFGWVGMGVLFVDFFVGFVLILVLIDC